jgi:hypothetical protein
VPGEYDEDAAPWEHMQEAVDILLIDTALRYHLHINPDELEDWEWVGSYAYLLEILKAEQGK